MTTKNGRKDAGRTQPPAPPERSAGPDTRAFATAVRVRLRRLPEGQDVPVHPGPRREAPQRAEEGRRRGRPEPFGPCQCPGSAATPVSALSGQGRIPPALTERRVSGHWLIYVRRSYKKLGTDRVAASADTSDETHLSGV
jgi:hypothetical protein